MPPLRDSSSEDSHEEEAPFDQTEEAKQTLEEEL